MSEKQTREEMDQTSGKKSDLTRLEKDKRKGRKGRKEGRKEGGC